MVYLEREGGRKEERNNGRAHKRWKRHTGERRETNKLTN
jgi:hypothetical protein